MGNHALDKKISGKVKQMLSNLDVYSSEFILLCTEYNKKINNVYMNYMYIYMNRKNIYGYILSLCT